MSKKRKTAILRAIININFSMNKAELIAAISQKTNIAKKDVEMVVEAFTEITTNTLQQGGEVVLAGFGAFMAKTRAGRMGVNPRQPDQKIQIPSVTVPKFKAGLNLKLALKGKKTPVAAPAPVAAAPVTAPVTPATPTTPTV
ncbi:MAG: HU family DNA-binding protein [bacterium]